MFTITITDEQDWVSLNAATGLPLGTKVTAQIQSPGAALLKTSTTPLSPDDHVGILLAQDGDNGFKVINEGADELFARTHGVYSVKINIERISV